MTYTPLPRSHTHTRVTVAVTPEVHEAFQELAAASGTSVGRAMGDWLEAQRDAVLMTAVRVDQAKSAPGLVMREMHAYSQGLADETGQLMKRVAAKGAAARRGGTTDAPTPPPPRLVIRGGNSTGKTKGHTP